MGETNSTHGSYEISVKFCSRNYWRECTYYLEDLGIKENTKFDLRGKIVSEWNWSIWFYKKWKTYWPTDLLPAYQRFLCFMVL